MNIPQPWQPHEERLLREMWGKGASAAEIAAELRGRSKNAVIGRVHRLNLHRSSKGPYMTQRRAANLHAEKVRREAEKAPAAIEPPPAPAAPRPTEIVLSPPPAPIRAPVSTHVMTLWADWPRDRCRRPVYQGKIEAKTQVFCGKEVVDAPYCPACAKALRLPPKKKRTEAEKAADYLRMLAQRKKAASR